MARAADVRRIEKLAPLGAGESVVACTRAWLSHPTRLKAITTNRVRTVVTVTDRRLIVASVAFWSRRPKRRAMVEGLEAIRVVDLPEVTGDRIEVVRGSASWILHFGDNTDAQEAVKALRYGIAYARSPAPPDAATDAEPDVAPGTESATPAPLPAVDVPDLAPEPEPEPESEPEPDDRSA